MRKSLLVLTYFWNLLVVLLLASAGLTKFPGLHHDAVVFSSVATNFAATGRWENESYLYGVVANGRAAFDTHGQLYQLLFGKFLRCESYGAFIAWAALINVCTFALALLGARKVLEHSYAGPAREVASSLIASVTAVACLYLQGRPEHLVPLLTLLPVVAWGFPRTRWAAPWFIYALPGLLGTLSPLTGVLGFVGVVAWLVLEPSQSAWRGFARTVLVSTVMGSAVIALGCGGDPLHWALRMTSGSGVSPTDWWTILRPTFTGVPLASFAVIVALAVFGLALVRSGSAWVAAASVILIVVLMSKGQVYTIGGFVPVTLILLLRSDAQGASASQPPLVARLAVWTVGIASVASLGRTMLMTSIFVTQGVSFVQARDAVKDLRDSLESPSERIGFLWLARPSLVALGQPGNGLVSVEMQATRNEPDTALRRYENFSGERVRYILVPQPPGLQKPPEFLEGNRFRIKSSMWIPATEVPWMRMITPTPPGYQFAVFERTGEP